MNMAMNHCPSAFAGTGTPERERDENRQWLRARSRRWSPRQTLSRLVAAVTICATTAALGATLTSAERCSRIPELPRLRDARRTPSQASSAWSTDQRRRRRAQPVLHVPCVLKLVHAVAEIERRRARQAALLDRSWPRAAWNRLAAATCRFCRPRGIALCQQRAACLVRLPKGRACWFRRTDFAQADGRGAGRAAGDGAERRRGKIRAAGRPQKPAC